MNSFFWKRVYKHLTINTFVLNDECKCNLCQVLNKDNETSKYMDDDGNAFVKESRFSYIRPIDGNTRLIVYNRSNITALDGVIHRGSKVVVEVPDGCMIVFTSDKFHADVRSYERRGGIYPVHLRLFVYIVEDNYISISEDVSKMSTTNKCDANCLTCEVMPNENIHYEGHIIRYTNTQCNIDKL